MEMRKNMYEVYNVLMSDENLARMLYYKPSNYDDDPLSPTKQNISDMSNQWEIKKHRIKRTIAISDILDEENELQDLDFCRVMMFPDGRYTSNNYLVSDQVITFHIWVNYEFDETDFRLSMICDYLNSLFSNKRITGLGKVRFYGGKTLGQMRQGQFIGYELSYEFGSGN